MLVFVFTKDNFELTEKNFKLTKENYTDSYFLSSNNLSL